ncbi:transposase [Paraburkholderia sabiae]|uniref:transposase n=1 Tax=Paraburkholderia sabiae TaxID=273251 RepID=UPI00363D2AC8
MVLRRSVPDLDEQGRTAAPLRTARDVQRASLDSGGRSFGWLNRFRRLARDYERLPETLAGLHFVVFSVLMLVHLCNP